MRNTTPENEKATAPVPAVGAAGEQSIINKTTDIITEKAGERNLRKGSLDTISMTDLYDTAYLNVNAERLFNEYGIAFESKRTHDGRLVTLTLANPPA